MLIWHNQDHSYHPYSVTTKKGTIDSLIDILRKRPPMIRLNHDHFYHPNLVSTKKGHSQCHILPHNRSSYHHVITPYSIPWVCPPQMFLSDPLIPMDKRNNLARHSQTSISHWLPAQVYNSRLTRAINQSNHINSGNSNYNIFIMFCNNHFENLNIKHEYLLRLKIYKKP